MTVRIRNTRTGQVGEYEAEVVNGDGTFSDVGEAIDAAVAAGAPAIASQAEAEAGVENTKMMTALRTAQAIAALGSLPYLVWAGWATQFLTNNPSVTEQVNQLGANLSFVYGGSAGVYAVTADANVFTQFKTVVEIRIEQGAGGGAWITSFDWLAANTLGLEFLKESAGAFTGANTWNAFIEIRVYL